VPKRSISPESHALDWPSAHGADELAAAMDVVDHLLAAVYTLPKRAAK
jgi:hypothetical protein